MLVRIVTSITFIFLAGIAVSEETVPGKITELKAEFLELKDDLGQPQLKFDGVYSQRLDEMGKRARELGDLDLALEVEAEKKGFKSGTRPAKDPQLRQLQAGYARETARLRGLKREAEIGLLRGYLDKLIAFRDSITRSGDLEKAQMVHAEVKKLEAELAETMRTPPPLQIRSVTKDRPYVNSLGMGFVPVPITGGPTDTAETGTRLLMGRFETRVEDFAVYAAKDPGAGTAWKDVKEGEVGQGGDHPVVNVSWEDARAFCAWLTKWERAKGVIPANAEYRLPSDHEWSCAVGIGRIENPEVAPSAKKGKVAGFPWGDGPTRHSVGNYADESAAKAGLKKGGNWVRDYDDGFAFTAPVGKYRVNELGLYDLGGNVAEWCQDEYESGSRVLRGASWDNFIGNELLSAFRDHTAPENRGTRIGFRCVLVVSRD